MNKINNKEGMTLVEIIVSLAILGVLSILFLNVFLGGLLLTIRSGDRVELVAESASSIERKIADTNYTNAAIVASSPASINIIYNYGTIDETSLPLDGLKVQTEVKKDDQLVQLDYFIPEE